MLADEKSLDRLVEVLQGQGERRNQELAELAAQFEQRNALLERQLGRKGRATFWLASLAFLLAVAVGGWVYLLMQRMADNVDHMASRIGQMQTYMRNMGAGQPEADGAGFMYSIARNTDNMSQDIGSMRGAMFQVSGDIATLRGDMQQMRDDIGSMNQVMGGMGGDIKLVSGNIAKMAQSVGHMNRNVGRMSRDNPYMRDPMRAMDSVIPWP